MISKWFTEDIQNILASHRYIVVTDARGEGDYLLKTLPQEIKQIPVKDEWSEIEAKYLAESTYKDDKVVFYAKKKVQQFLFNRINGEWMMTSINYKPMYTNMNASFLKFYGKFATDSAFQAEHLHNPVKFVGPDPDDDFSTMSGDIEPETWPAFAPQLPHGMIYNIIYGQKYAESNQKIFVIRGIANGMETILTFKRVHGKWMLTKLNM